MWYDVVPTRPMNHSKESKLILVKYRILNYLAVLLVILLHVCLRDFLKGRRCFVLMGRLMTHCSASSPVHMSAKMTGGSVTRNAVQATQ